MERAFLPLLFFFPVSIPSPPKKIVGFPVAGKNPFSPDPLFTSLFTARSATNRDERLLCHPGAKTSAT
ncbi:MAG TPA: hypothetical protein PLC05_01245 [bacterium]|nr:hypothetical protein [bacterium]HOR57407.1 hypothetical protein [bacterium]HPL56110.1 hypothetical protein [bacterium]